MYYPNYSNPGVEHSCTRQCIFCGHWHIGKCSKVKKIEFNIDCSIKNIEFFSTDEEKKENIKKVMNDARTT